MSIKSNRIKVKKKLNQLLSESKFAREDSAEFVVIVLDLLEDSEDYFLSRIHAKCSQNARTQKICPETRVKGI